MNRPIYITESDVEALLDMPAAIAALEDAFHDVATGDAVNSPRVRARYWNARLNIMSAGRKSGRFGFKAYAGTNAPTVYHVMLYDQERGLVAILEARRLSRLRTGAATGVAVRRLAREGAGILGVIGAGEQSLTQIQAIAAVRPLRNVHVYARNRDGLLAFCERMARETGLAVKAAASAKECVSSADIVLTATTSETPVVRDEWLRPDAHVSTIGANAANRMELEPTTFARASLVVTDDIEQAKKEAGEIIRCVADGAMSWDSVAPLSRIVAAPPEPRGLSIFKSLGAAIEDLAVASAAYDLALAHGRGQPL